MRGSGEWLRMPVELIGKVSPTAAIVAAVICDRGNMRTIELTGEQLATAAGCCVRTVRTALHELESQGFCVVHRTRSGLEITPAELMLPKRSPAGIRSSALALAGAVRGARPLQRLQRSSIDIREAEKLVNNFGGELPGQLTFTGTDGKGGGAR